MRKNQIIEVLKDTSIEYNDSKLLEELLELALELQQRKNKYRKRVKVKPLKSEIAHVYIRLIKAIEDYGEDDIKVEIDKKLEQLKRNSKNYKNKY